MSDIPQANVNLNALRQTALGVLVSNNNDPRQALKPFVKILRSQSSLFEELALGYLNYVSSQRIDEVQAPRAAEAASQLTNEPLWRVAGGAISSPTAVETHSLRAADLGGHAVFETQRSSAAEPLAQAAHETHEVFGDTARHSFETQTDHGDVDRPSHSTSETRMKGARPVDVKKHKRQRPRSHQEIEAAKAAAATSVRAVYNIRIGNRALGDIAWGELRSLKKQQVHEATANLMLGIDQAQKACLFELLDASCVVTDTTLKIREVVNAQKLSELVEMAKRMAPARVELGIARANEAMEQPDQPIQLQ